LGLPTGNPNFNLKNRPEVNKSGPGDANLGSFDLFVIYGGRCYKHSANKLVDILSGDISGVDISPIYGSRYIVGRYIGGRHIVGRLIAVAPLQPTTRTSLYARNTFNDISQ
jgi:hypothetical protein